MLPKIYRLPAGKKHIPSKTLTTEYFRVLISPNKQQHNRFGFVVSKKIDKRAVVRNRLKRVLREIVKGFLQTTESYDILFIVTKNFITISTQEMQKIVIKEFQSANLKMQPKTI